MTNFWQRLELFPPILVRLLAVKPHAGPLSDTEISLKSGIPVYQVMQISQGLSWDGIDVTVVRKFTLACGVDFCDRDSMRNIRQKIRHNEWRQLRLSKEWKTLYQPMMRRWLDDCKRKMNNSHA